MTGVRLPSKPAGAHQAGNSDITDYHPTPVIADLLLGRRLEDCSRRWAGIMGVNRETCPQQVPFPSSYP